MPEAPALWGAGWGIVVSVLALGVQAQFDSDAATYWRVLLVVTSIAACAFTSRRLASRRR